MALWQAVECECCIIEVSLDFVGKREDKRTHCININECIGIFHSEEAHLFMNFSNL